MFLEKVHIFKVFFTITIIFSLIYLIITKPLSKETLKYLEADQETYDNYRVGYRELSCKLLTYSKMKQLYEHEIIDGFINQTDKKKNI